MIYAVYRCLYGEDFCQESIKAIEKYCDKIFVFWDDTAWGDVTSCVYKNEVINFPKKFDSVIDRIKELNNQKIILQYDHRYNNLNQFTIFINDFILCNYSRPDIIMIPEIDHVFKENQLDKAVNEFIRSKDAYRYTLQEEIWKYKWVVPRRRKLWKHKWAMPRRRRIGAGFWNLRKVHKLPRTMRQGDIPSAKEIPALKAHVHNMGFSVTNKTMYWKHMTALGFSQKIKDSMPNESWYEEKWLKFHPEKNNFDLEISMGREKDIPYVNPYLFKKLPVLIQQKMVREGL